jgi:CubicO group peptidase (beta-lactamase class C family)
MRILVTMLALVLLALPTLGRQAPAGLAGTVQPFVAAHQVAGAVLLVADRERILAHEAVGYADVATQMPMKIDSVFWIASQTKPITATALMLLVDEGKLKLDDPVEQYLPEFKNIQLAGKKPTNTMTVRQLLNHTSGMPFKSTQEQPTLDVLSIKDSVLTYTQTPLVSEPGTKFLYSNCGINTAGRLIEVIAQMPYETFLQKRLLDPLGMKETTFWPTPEQVPRLAKVYKPNAAKTNLEVSQIQHLRYPLTDRQRQPMPGGGLFSTAGDVAKFCQLILNEGKWEGKQLVSAAAVAEMTRKQTPADLKDAYGLGFAVNGAYCGHGGALATDMAIDRTKGIITVYLVQHQGFPGEGAKAKDKFREAALAKFAISQ